MFMEHFHPLKINNKVCLSYLERKLQQDRYGVCIWKSKYLKSKENVFRGKQTTNTRYRPAYSELSKMEKWYG